MSASLTSLILEKFTIGPLFAKIRTSCPHENEVSDAKLYWPFRGEAALGFTFLLVLCGEKLLLLLLKS
jgi:hypothetical protein